METVLNFVLISTRHRSSDDLQGLLHFIIDILNDDLKSHIWFNDQLVMKIHKSEMIVGNVNCSDSTEDEWYVVYLLFKLTSIIDDVVIQVSDGDGEFLLIQAAEVLPKWAQESMENRVFIYRNALHILPVATNPSQLTSMPYKGKVEEAGDVSTNDVKRAALAVTNFSSVTLATSEVQEAIRSRIVKSLSNDHRLHLTLPSSVVSLLRIFPQLVSTAVHYVDTASTKELNMAREMSLFAPSTDDDDDLVTVSMTLPKHLVAVLRHRQLVPHKRTAWASLLGSQESKRSQQHLKDGFKVATGLQIIHLKASIRCQVAEKLPTTEQSGIDVKEWLGNVYQHFYCPREFSSNDYLEAFRKVSQKLFNVEDSSVILDHCHHSSQIVSRELEVEDDDSWLEFNSDSFDQMLKEHFGKSLEEDDLSEEMDAFLKIDKKKPKLERRLQLDDQDFKKSALKLLNQVSKGEDSADSDSDWISEDDEEQSSEFNAYFDAMDRELKNKSVKSHRDETTSVGENLLQSLRSQELVSSGPVATIVKGSQI